MNASVRWTSSSPTAEGDATQAAEQAVRDGYDHLFVGGGDGTLNEVLNGVARLEHGLSQVTFGVIPLGTGNDFATALGLPDRHPAMPSRRFLKATRRPWISAA